MYPVDVKIRVKHSKANGFAGNFTILEVLARRLQIRKEFELGIEKQKRPFEAERSTAEGGRREERESDELRHELRIVSYREYWWRNWGWESNRNEDEDLDEEEKCFEMKKGEKIKDRKCLQVDRRFKTVFRGRHERTCSRSSSGRLLHRTGSMSGEVARESELQFLTMSKNLIVDYYRMEDIYI